MKIINGNVQPIKLNLIQQFCLQNFLIKRQFLITYDKMKSRKFSCNLLAKSINQVI